MIKEEEEEEDPGDLDMDVVVVDSVLESRDALEKLLPLLRIVGKLEGFALTSAEAAFLFETLGHRDYLDVLPADLTGAMADDLELAVELATSYGVELSALGDKVAELGHAEGYLLFAATVLHRAAKAKGYSTVRPSDFVRIAES